MGKDPSIKAQEKARRKARGKRIQRFGFRLIAAGFLAMFLTLLLAFIIGPFAPLIGVPGAIVLVWARARDVKRDEAT